MMLNKALLKNITTLELIMAAVALTVAVCAAKILEAYLRRSFKEKIRKDNLEIIIKIIKYAIIGIAAVYALGVLGFNLSGLLVAGGIAGVVLGFASQRIVGNLISGIFLIIERPIKIGDQVKIDDYTGFVEDIRIVSTTLRTYDGLYVRIPNEKIFTSHIVNYVSYIVRRFEYTFGMRPQDDAEKALSLIKQVIEEHPLALRNPEPRVFVDSLGDTAVMIIVQVWAPVSEWFSVKTELLWKIKKTLGKKGIDIPFK